MQAFTHFLIGDDQFVDNKESRLKGPGNANQLEKRMSKLPNKEEDLAAGRKVQR